MQFLSILFGGLAFTSVQAFANVAVAPKQPVCNHDDTYRAVKRHTGDSTDNSLKFCDAYLNDPTTVVPYYLKNSMPSKIRTACACVNGPAPCVPVVGCWQNGFISEPNTSGYYTSKQCHDACLAQDGCMSYQVGPYQVYSSSSPDKDKKDPNTNCNLFKLAAADVVFKNHRGPPADFCNRFNVYDITCTQPLDCPECVKAKYQSA